MGDIIVPYNWAPRTYQLRAWTYFQGPELGKRAACVWHRRAGKDLFAINLIQTKVLERVGLYWHMLPTYKQGRAIVWNGFTREGRRFLDHFHPKLVKEKHTTEMRVTFINGSQYQVVGTDDVDSLVGTNPIGVVFSEYSLHDPAAWDFIRPILAENGGWALFIYTARGKNHGWRLLEMARKNPLWFHEVLTAGSGPNDTKRPDGSPVISDEVIEEERRSGMPEEMIQQEFKCSFEAALIGSYYGQQMLLLEKMGRIGVVPHEPKLQVHTAWDLGIDDSTAIWFFQEFGNETRVIDYYEASGEAIRHYVKVLRGQVEGYERMSEYVYGKHFAPHDIEVRELSSGKSRLEFAKELGVRFSVVRQHEIEDGIEVTRAFLPRCWFDEKLCARGIEALRSYRKEWDDRRKTFRSVPLHDWSSHAADAFRTYAMGRRERSRDGNKPRRQVDEFDYLHQL